MTTVARLARVQTAFPDPDVVSLLHKAVTPGPQVQCSCCEATAARRDPPGWVVANAVVDLGLKPRTGICPACLTTTFDFPAEG